MRRLLLLLALAIPLSAPAEEPPEGPTMRLSGTPDIPDALRSRFNQYLSTRSAWLTDIAPDGDAVLVSTRFGEASQLHLVSEPLGMREQLTFRPEPTRRGAFVPGSDDLLFSGDIGGNEQYQVFRLSAADGSVSLLTDGENRHGFPVLNRAGDRYAWSSNQRNGTDTDVWLANTDGSDPLLVGEAEGSWYPIEFSPDGSKLLVLHYVSTTDRRLKMCATDGSGCQSITNPKKPQAWKVATWHPNGEELFVSVDSDGEFARLYRVGRGRKGIAPSRTWTPLTDDIDWDVEDAVVSPDGSTLALTVNEEGYSSLWLLDVATGTKKKVDLPQGILARVMWARNANVLGFTRTDPTSTGDVWTYRLEDGALTQWTKSEVGGIPQSSLVAPTLERTESFDGLSVPMFVYTPPGEGPHPVVVAIHGGPEGQARPYFSSRTQAMVAAGLAVVVPNVRGSAGYGRTYVSMDNGFLREDSVKDIGAVLDWIAARPDTYDAARVGVSGGSYGGYMVLASLTMFPERIAAGVDVVGISNFVTFLENTKSYRRDLRRVEYGDERDPKMREFLERISPTANADKIKAALFVAHGANDPRVPVGEAEQIVEVVRGNGQDVWSMIAMDEGHGFSKRTNRDTFNLLQLLFFEKHLLAD